MEDRFLAIIGAFDGVGDVPALRQDLIAVTGDCQERVIRASNAVEITPV